jgi:hypothetical protein
MIIKLGFVRDGHIVGTKFYSQHETVMVPIFTSGDVEKIVKAMQMGGPRNLCAFPPHSMKRSVDELTRWIPDGWADYLAGLPPQHNPTLQHIKTPGGIITLAEGNKAP